VDLLRGLIHDDDSRVNTVFGLREHFPMYCGCPSRFATADEVPKPASVLTNEAKRILAWTAREADAIHDYWIDTEHLLLGILREPRCQATQFLAKTGLTLQSVRSAALANKGSRPDYGPVSQWWALQSPWSRMISKWRMRRYRRIGE